MTGDEEEPFLFIFGETAVASTMKDTPEEQLRQINISNQYC